MAALYHVFLSFRGADIRKTFADHLYRALIDAGLRTFRDDDEIKRGEVIASELEKAIRQSRSSIIVLSEDYASSRWCLNELQLILEQKRNNSKYIVIPVFYHVDPSDVRHQKGKFGEAFGKHKERFAEDEEKKMEKIKSWKKSLKDVADFKGNDLYKQANGHEAEFIKLIVEELTKQLDLPILNVDPPTVGIDSLVEDINCWLQKESADVGIAAISGMGGIGKTTIAKVVYNKNYSIFEASSFLANIRQACEQHDGLIVLLKQLSSDILKGRELKTNNVDVGINQIRDALRSKRLLLVLDDVDRSDQLHSILGSLEWFCAGSKIIVTTRHERLLETYESCQMFKVRKLNDDDALLLFSRHAFKKDHPTEGYMEHAKNFVQKCGGIPLAIKVLGISLLGRDLAYWESVIERMDYVFDSDILKVLRISYDSLKDDLVKRLFLDIACFFVGKDLKFAVQVLHECGLFPTSDIPNLVSRCLITVSEDNKLMIHQLLQDMAREIVRQESPEHPGSRTRVWHHKDAFETLKEKSGTERVTGLIFNLPLMKEQDVDLETTAFSRMHNLQFLHLDYVRLSGGYREFPKKLRWLSWHGFHLKCIPSDFDMEKLVVLDMRNSYLVNVWNGAKSMEQLKILNLSHSHCLVNTPNFSGVPNLEELILKDCIKLEVIHDSIKELRKLVLLDLEGCKSFRNFGIFEQLKSLEKLNLSNCLNLEEYLPVELGEKESLTLLSADGTAINRLPSMSGHLRNVCNSIIAKVSRSFWPKTSLTMVPKPIQFSLASLPISLKHLNLADSRLTDDVMPVDMSCLSSLEYLNLGGNLLTRLPESIKGLTMLEKLELDSCKRLESLPELPWRLRSLSANRCVSLERIKYQPNRSRRRLEFKLNDCEKLVELENVFMVAPLVNFDMKMVCDLGLVGFESIEEGIQVEMYNRLTHTRKKGPVQGVYEFGILSTFYPCSKVPDWFSIKALVNGQKADIRFTIPSLVNMKIRCLSFCTVYVWRNDIDIDAIIYDRIRVCVSNLSKCVRWTYTPTIVGVGRRNEEMIWIGQSSFGNKFEGGDQVQVSFSCEPTRLHMKEVGVHVYYEKEIEIEQHTTNQSVIEGGGFQSYDDMLRAHSLDSDGDSMISPFEFNRSIRRYRDEETDGTDESWEATHYLESPEMRHEAEFIKLIVKELAKKWDRPILNVDPHTVGIDSLVEDINCWLQKESADVGIAAISGMGGIGKTTVAKVVYNKNYSIFEASSFLTNTRQACEQPNGLIVLLKQLFSDIFKGRKLKTDNVDGAINQIRDALGCKRLLLVLDDVDRSDQLHSILGSLDWFCEGSKIIVTTRHVGLLNKAYDSCQMFKVSNLNDDDALLLFSRHAFKKDHPTEGYMGHAKNFVQKCGGIPLAIQVLGTSLLGESLAYWESVIEKMDYVFESDILKVLRISYDSLKDDLDKSLFLDIACFFVGKDINFAVQVLNECDLFPTAGIQNLVNRCLITVSVDNKLMIHQLLQDMAREIIRQEYPNDPGSRTRVWHHKDAFEILKEKSGTKRVTGLILNLLPMKEDVDLETTAFSRMRNLQFLHLDYVRISGGYGEMPKKLRWLS